MINNVAVLPNPPVNKPDIQEIDQAKIKSEKQEVSWGRWAVSVVTDIVCFIPRLICKAVKAIYNFFISDSSKNPETAKASIKHPSDKTQPASRLNVPRQASPSESGQSVPLNDGIQTSRSIATPKAQPVALPSRPGVDIKHSVTPFFLNFNELSNKQQATAILDEALKLVKKYPKLKGVGVTYSANHRQTKEQILPAYEKEKWKTGVNGANQASVMNTLEKELDKNHKYAALQKKFHIIPISTCQKAGGNGPCTDNEFKLCIDNLNQHVKDGWQILGLQNQTTEHNKDAPFAVGNGVSKAMPAHHKDEIQALLKYYAGLN